MKIGLFLNFWQIAQTILQLFSQSVLYIKSNLKKSLIMKVFIGMVLAVIIGVILASYVKTALKIS